MDAFDDTLFDSFEAATEVKPAVAPAKRPAEPTIAEQPKRQREGVAQKAEAAPVPPAAAAGGAAADAPASDEKPTGKTCKHEVAMPNGAEPDIGMIELTYPEVVPAKTYPFELDPFQKAAVACIERDESVLVSAHTSAGKTVCAEYAIATALRAKQRVIYTSPIKALSNQKYRELKEEFADVGLLTGDVTIDVNASCLVMTTEILRSMLYRGSEVMREVKWVIFDEVHYMRDKERGVVWEESMILLPHKVRYVFLSATIPNALEFAEWIASLHGQPCHVVYTEYRPTPLQHYMFPSGGDGIHLIVDEQSTFQPANFQRAASSIKPKTKAKGPKGGKGGKGGKQEAGPSDIYKLVKMVVERSYSPLIVFAFGKKLVEALAKQMGPLDLNSPEERAMVQEIFASAVDTLCDDDKTLPQVEGLLPLLQRGIAVHHSGLLPVLKEVVELLFQENLVKMLFATETFAMGLNMPARTVIFADLSKFDGKEFRYLTSGEYIQMSGRAGRRGLDTRGVVIQMVDERTDLAQVRGMLDGAADTLSSKFHLSYNMLLNCVRVETADVELLITKSFYTYQLQRRLPELQRDQRALAARLASAEMQLADEALLLELHQAERARLQLKDALRLVANQPLRVLPFLQLGRLAQVRAPLPRPAGGDDDDAAGGGADDEPLDWGWGVLVNFRNLADDRGGGGGKKQKGGGKDSDGVGRLDDYTVDVLLRCAPGAEAEIAAGRTPTPMPTGDAAELHVLTMPLAHVDSLSSIKLQMPADLRPGDARHTVLKVVREVERRFPGTADKPVPLLAPADDMNVDDERVPRLLRKLEAVDARLAEPRLAAPELRGALPQLRAKLELEAAERALRKEVKAAQAVLMKDELKGMRRVLRRLGHVSDDGVIQNKGRVACEVSTADELLVTELMFSGVFNELDPKKLASLLSCLVVTEGGSSKDDKGDGACASAIRTEAMREPVQRMRDLARRIGAVVEEAKLPIEIEEYVERFKPSLVDVVHEWCGGAKFVEICKIAEGWYEGSIVRTMHRLEELLRQLMDAAKLVGNDELETRCGEARKLLIRDVVFAASLYT